MNSSQKNLFLLSAYYLVLSTVLIGCATVMEGAKNVVGVSTRALEDDRNNAIKKTFNYNYNKSYEEVKAALRLMKCYIYAEDLNKKLIAVYVSEEDTTPVGIFLTVVNEFNTQIEISSPSTYAKESIATRLFKVLSGEKEKGESDAEKELPNK